MKVFTDRQREIITESINILSDKGIQELTIKNIAQRINVTEPALYRHFNNKIDILFAILEYYKTQVHKLQNEISPKKNNFDKIKEYILGHYKNFKKDPSIATILFSEDSFKIDRKLSQKIGEIIDLNQKYIRDVVDSSVKKNEIRNDIPKEHLVVLIMGSFRFLIRKWRKEDYNFDLEKEGDKLWSSLSNIISTKK